MIRSGLALLLFPLVIGWAGAQGLGRSDAVWREYLAETVSRGLPLLADANSASVPFWPSLDISLVEAQSLEPGADTDLVVAWAAFAQGDAGSAAAALRAPWPSPSLGRFSARSWAEALFAAWDPATDADAWTKAWLAWQDKAYSPRALVRGLETLEKSDASAVLPLLSQALKLYPEDRRFLPLMARHPGAAVSASALLSRDLALTGGWAPSTVRALLTRSPVTRELVAAAGYTAPRLDAALSRDYGTWLRQSPPTALGDGWWSWDSDEDGQAESVLNVQKGQLATWSRHTTGGLWTLSFVQGKPDTLVETRGGAVWTLKYEAYPWARDLMYRWADKTLDYRFRPLAQAVPLWPAERFAAPLERLPAALASLWLPLHPGSLALSAASIEAWEGTVRTQTVYLYDGEVWLDIEDSNRDGKDDSWSYFRSGVLSSVYRDFEGRGQANLRELYSKGQLDQVQSRSSPGRRAEFVLFPAQDVQLWDPHSTGRPLDRIFVWSGGEKLQALVFSGATLPWETMPNWEPRP